MRLIGISSKESKMKLPLEPRMYIITRKELSDSYRMVQGAHALAQYGLEHPNEFEKWNNKFLIFLGTFLPESLIELRKRLSIEGIKTSSFHEPDLDNQMTAFSVFYDPSDTEESQKIVSIIGSLPLA